MAESTSSTTYHPLGGLAVSTERHPGTLADCADSVCVAIERLRLDLMHSEQRHAMTQTALTQAESERDAARDARITMPANPLTADECDKVCAAVAETAVRLDDAGYRGNLVNSVTRLIADAASERESRFRWAEEAARLEASAALLPEDWKKLVTDDLKAWGQSATMRVLTLIESWRPTAVEAAPPPSDLQVAPSLGATQGNNWDGAERWCEPCGAKVSGSHWHCGKCGQPSSMMGHSACFASSDSGTEATDV